ncbi:hypothetical protein [Pseudonocardia sp.]|uniref:hypothetical protein n=1 Tax=Pseudonocardia sp. TaxID=60912 RepID=UPI003D130EBE
MTVTGSSYRIPAPLSGVGRELLDLLPGLVEAARTTPPLAVVHRLPPDRQDALARLSEAGAGSPELARLGSAAARLRALRAAARAARTCPACGFDGLDGPPYLAFEGLPQDGAAPLVPPYAVAFGDPSGTRCPCCGYGFGLDDDPADGSPPVTFEAWGARWRARGRPWSDPARRPSGSDPATGVHGG